MPLRPALRALLPFLLHAFARALDAALWLPLRSAVVPDSMLQAALAGLEPASVATHLAAGAALALLAWLGVALPQRAALGWGAALRGSAAGFWPLLLRPAITLLAFASLAIEPRHPYAFTLPVALTQDWSMAQDLLALAALVVLHAPRLKIPAPGAASLCLMAFMAYGLLTPEWARHWDGHSGNEPKTLRQAVAIGHGLTLDAEGVSDAMERLEVLPLLEAAETAIRATARENVALLGTLLEGPDAWSPSRIRATRITRQTVRGKDGGVFYVLSPGVSVVLAPALRLDRAVNLRRGTEGRLAVTLLLWNALAAALVASLFLLARAASGSAGAAALAAGGAALAPPFLFYAYQFYPEMLGALLLSEILRRLFFEPRLGIAGWAIVSALLATLPWLHQKFLPVWAVLVVLATFLAVERMLSGKALLALLVAQVATLYELALYNFAITGSPRLDALFLAWGPGGVAGTHLGGGLAGLALDARYGLLPYAPIYALGLGVLALPGARAARWRLAALPVLAYYVTVAAADNWSGAVSHLGRYAMPALPLLVAGAAVVIAALGALRGVAFVAVFLAGWTGLLTLALYRDPHAANDVAVLLAGSALADGHSYVPDLFYRSVRFLASGHAARVAAWLLLGLALLWYLRRAAEGRGGHAVRAALLGAAALLVSGGLLLEAWPSSMSGPRFGDAIDVGEGVVVRSLQLPVERGEFVAAPQGRLELAVQASRLPDGLVVVAEGPGAIEIGGAGRVLIPPSGTRTRAPLVVSRRLLGRDGEEQWARLSIDVTTPERVYLRFAPE